MTAHGRVRLAAEFEQRPDARRDLVSVVIVEDVQYAPRWSWEIEQVIEADPGKLPADLAPVARAWIDALFTELSPKSPTPRPSANGRSTI